MPSLIYKILRPTEWQEANATATFAGASVDLTDGFIHFSTAHQIGETAARHFGDSNTIYVLTIDPAALPADKLKWEPSRDGDLFPHLFAPLPMSAVINNRRLTRGPTGFDFSYLSGDDAQ